MPIRLAAAFLLALLGVVWNGGRADAQSCISDSQCSAGGNSANSCYGDTLVMRRRICSSGQCVTMQTGQMKCPAGSRCDGMAGSCAPSGVLSPFPQGGAGTSGCPVTCSCTGNTLTIGTGVRVRGACARSVVQCRKGCTCSPDARCGEDPRPRLGGRAEAARTAAERAEAYRSPGAVAATAAARASRAEASTLPPRTAEPFAAAPGRAATPRRATQRRSRPVRLLE